MAHVITTACIDCKDGACVPCCPVDCIYEGERTGHIKVASMDSLFLDLLPT